MDRLSERLCGGTDWDQRGPESDEETSKSAGLKVWDATSQKLGKVPRLEQGARALMRQSCKMSKTVNPMLTGDLDEQPSCARGPCSEPAPVKGVDSGDEHKQRLEPHSQEHSHIGQIQCYNACLRSPRLQQQRL